MLRVQKYLQQCIQVDILTYSLAVWKGMLLFTVAEYSLSLTCMRCCALLLVFSHRVHRIKEIKAEALLIQLQKIVTKKL